MLTAFGVQHPASQLSVTMLHAYNDEWFNLLHTFLSSTPLLCANREHLQQHQANMLMTLFLSDVEHSSVLPYTAAGLPLNQQQHKADMSILLLQQQQHLAVPQQATGHQAEPCSSEWLDGRLRDQTGC